MNAPQTQRRLPAPSDAQLLQEAAALVSDALGKQYVFNSRGLFHRWLQTDGMRRLVAEGAMNPINDGEWSSLEHTVALLRMQGKG